VVFIALTTAVCAYFLVKNLPNLKSEHKLESLVSRESSFLFNNLLLLILCFTVLWGTFFPILSEWVQGHKVTVGPPFFNRVFLPIALALLLLTAIGPLLAWRKTSLESVVRNFLWPAIASLAVGLLMVVFGVRLWESAPWFYTTAAILYILMAAFLFTALARQWAGKTNSLDRIGRTFLFPLVGSLGAGLALMACGVHPSEDPSYFYATMAAILSFLVIFTVVLEFLRGGRVIAEKTQQDIFGAMFQLCHRNTRRYGGYIVHFGVALVGIGILGAAFNKEVEKEMSYGDKIQLGAYTLVCQSYTQDDNPNYAVESAMFNIYRGSKLITTMAPERRFYKASGQPQTMPNIYPTFMQDLFLVNDIYLVYEGKNDTTGRPIIKAHLNPLVPWIWIGLVIMVFGTVVALVPNYVPVTVTAPAHAPVRETAHAGAGD